jgi:FKBP-type peptidyl-prolyl cis-trans isomerase/Domain amino terminal to FKBP-type peptidyl-prolyl isomerase
MTNKLPSADWVKNLSPTMKAAIGGGAVCLLLTLGIFAPGGLLSSLTGPSEIEAPPPELFPVEQPQESAIPAELSVEKNEAFLAANAKKDGVKVTSSGLHIRSLKSGTGKQPGPDSKVTIHYTGKLINPLGIFIPGWIEGLQLMKEGEKVELVVPQDLGYGEAGHPGTIPPLQTLVFEVELFKVE